MSDWIKALIACLVLLGGGVAWAVTNFVGLSQFEQHLANEESRYVLELKQDIRDLQKRLAANPDNDYLQDELVDQIDALCEMRPDDRLCD
jgi:hypothetical protein